MRFGIRFGLGLTTVAFGLTCMLTAAEKAETTATVVAKGIANPSGLAVQPKTGHVFIAANTGVHRLVPGKKAVVAPEVTGFNTDVYGKGPKYDIGPLGVAILDDQHIVVGDGGNPDATEVVQVFKVGAMAPKKPLTPKDAAFTLGPIKAGAESVKGEGNYYGVAVTEAGIYVTCNGDDTKGWVARSVLTDGKPGDLKPFIPTKIATGVDAPVGITTAMHGKTLVISQMGEMNVPNDSLLTMYDAESGKLNHSLKTGLSDIAGLAYSPKTHKLYVVDFSWIDTTKGGLFRLDVDGETVTSEKILSLDKPSALAFDAEGGLYISVFGSGEGEEAHGEILYVKPGL